MTPGDLSTGSAVSAGLGSVRELHPDPGVNSVLTPAGHKSFQCCTLSSRCNEVCFGSVAGGGGAGKPPMVSTLTAREAWNTQEEPLTPPRPSQLPVQRILLGAMETGPWGIREKDWGGNPDSASGEITSFLEYGWDFYIYSGDWKLVWFFSGMGPSTNASGGGGQGKAVGQMTTTLTVVFRAGTQAGLLFVDVMFGLREEPAKKVPVMGLSDCAKVLWQQRLGTM